LTSTKGNDMKVTWLQNGKQGSAMMGNILEDCGKYYRVIVTSWESRRFSKLLGQEVMVRKSTVTILN